MSKKTEETIVDQMEAITLSIEEAQVKLAELATALKVIKEEPRHGDYGVSCCGRDFFVVRDYQTLELRRCGSETTAMVGVRGDDKILGNVVDLLKQAGDGGVLIALTEKEAKWMANPGQGQWLSPIGQSIEAKVLTALNK